MKEIPKNFSSATGQENHKYFFNLIVEFKKLLESSRDIDMLQIQMEKFLNAAKDMNFKKEKKEIFKKDEAEKIISRIWNEFKRYLEYLLKKEKQTNLQDLLDEMEKLKKMVEEGEIT